MRIPLNYEQCLAIHGFITVMLNEYQADNIPEDLVDDHMLDIKEKFHKKLNQKHVKEWAITLNPKEAKAYWTFFSREQAYPAGYRYELNLIQKHLTEIDRKYAPRKKPVLALTSGQKSLNGYG